VQGDPPRPDTAAVARLRSALCGGPHGRERERRAAARIEELLPGARRLAQAAEAFHGRAALWAVTMTEADGMPAASAVALASSGYPPMPAPEWEDAELPHLRAAAARAAARFVYCDRDAALSLVWRHVLRGDPSAAACCASAYSPGDVAAAAVAAGHGGPVSVQLQMGLHWCRDDVAARLVAGYAAVMPEPGSSLVLSLAIPGPGRGDRRVAAVFEDVAGAPVYAHRPGDITGWLDAAGLVPHPQGVTDVRAWPGRPWADGPLSAGSRCRVVAAVGLRR
jgi:S-adenosyl methyltransferase